MTRRTSLCLSPLNHAVGEVGGRTEGLTDGSLHFVTLSKVIGPEEEREKAEREEGLERRNRKKKIVLVHLPMRPKVQPNK